MASRNSASAASSQGPNPYSIGRADQTPKIFPPGYPALAGKMAHYPQLMILRRFNGLAARNLLYIQAELKCLEHDLIELEIRDQKNTQFQCEDFSGNWELLSKAIEPNNEQWNKVLEIRAKLKEYCTFRAYGSETGEFNSVGR